MTRNVLPLPGAQLGQVLDRFLGRDVVHQHVQAAEFGHGLLHGALAVVLGSEIAADGHAPLPGLTDQFRSAGGILILGIGQVRDGDVGAFLGEGHRHGPPDTRIATRDQRPGSCQQAPSFVITHLIARPWVHLGGPAGIRLLLPWR